MSRPRRFDEDDVVERAMEELWADGHAATSPARLAETTDIVKGGLCNTSSSKHAPFERYLDKYQQQIVKLAEGLMDHPGAARECLRDTLRAVVDSDLAQVHRRGCLIGNTAVGLASDDPDLARRVRKIQSESTAWFVRRVERGQREGDVRPDLDATAFAEHMATTLADLRVMAVTHEVGPLYRVIGMALMALQTSWSPHTEDRPHRVDRRTRQ